MNRFLVFSIFVFLISCNTGTDTDATRTSGPDSVTARLLSLQSLVEQYPDSVDLRVQLAVELETREQYDRALNEYDNLLIQDSTNTLWYNRKAELLLKTGDTSAAISTIQYSIDQNPEQPGLFLELGFLYANMNDSRALRIADQVIKAADDERLKSQARYLKGIYFSNTGDKDKAIKAFDECILNDYTFIDAYLEKGIMLYQQSKYQEALTTFEKARTISNTNADAYFWTGKVYEALNNREEAIGYYQRALGLDGSLAEAETALKNLERK